ncbi:MAG: hypothetical protein ACK5LL_12180 [Suipraeoptans sp.]
MNISKLRELSFEDIRISYKDYLQKQNLSINTINTSSVDAFYLWRKGSSNLFWNVITSDNFEIIAKKELVKALQENSKGNANSLVSGYMSHLRRFRHFLDSGNYLEVNSTQVKRNVPRIKSKVQKDVPIPSESIVEEYLAKWDTLENYQLQEKALNKLFLELCPANKQIEDVLLKASTLNDFYSTNIFSIYPVAKHICSLDIDKRLANGDVMLVGDIQEVVIGGVKKNFYSFATKYCSHHNSLDYPIYDSYVDEVLRHFRKQDRFFYFSDIDLKNYEKFKSILSEFRKFYGLEKYNLKQIDQYIWQLGKDYFPKNYNKKK